MLGFTTGAATKLKGVDSSVSALRFGVAVDFPREGSQIGHMKHRVRVEPSEAGVFVAEGPSHPGCISQGKTRSEALAKGRLQR